jgi:uncharacterized membrane protein HdeD (DUF308 family)
MEPQGHPARPARRPTAVLVVGLLALAVGGYHVAHAIAVLIDREDSSTIAEGALDLVLGLLAIAIALAALRMRRWAWVAFMTWALIGLVHQLLRYFFYDHPDDVAMALDAFVVLVLTPLDVQIAFGIRPPRNVPLEHTTHPGELV